jgi:hypothetical protein
VDVDAVDADLAARHREQAERQTREGRLPGAGLADEPEGLPLVDRERDVVDRRELVVRVPEAGPALDREDLRQAVDLDEGRAVAAHARSRRR